MMPFERGESAVGDFLMIGLIPTCVSFFLA